MFKRSGLFLIVVTLLYWTLAYAQHPVLDALSNKVVQKYQQASCEELAKQKSEPKSAQEQKMLEKLRSDPQMRAEFINKVAAPIANKLFECGLIP